MNKFIALAAFAAMAWPVTSQAAFIFQASLDGAQEVGPTTSTASGTATLTLNDARTRLEISVSLTGVDLDGAQTPGDPNDNVLAFHLHNAPFGANGGVVFGFIGPNNDANGDLVINTAAGTVFSAWDLTEGNGTTLAAQLPNLFNGGLYFNVHTPAFPGGEIRGQVVPAPAALFLVGFGLFGIGALRRRA